MPDGTYQPGDQIAPGTPRVVGSGGLPGQARPGFGVGLFGAEAGGPMVIGAHEDMHRHGTTPDGEPINSGHLGTNSLFFLRQMRDAPLKFQDRPKPPVASFPMKSKVHLVFDEKASHGWMGGSLPGIWDWYAEVPEVPTGGRPPPPTGPPPTGPPTTPTPPPPPTTGPPPTSGRGPGPTTGPGSGTNPGPGSGGGGSQTTPGAGPGSGAAVTPSSGARGKAVTPTTGHAAAGASPGTGTGGPAPGVPGASGNPEFPNYPSGLPLPFTPEDWGEPGEAPFGLVDPPKPAGGGQPAGGPAAAGGGAGAGGGAAPPANPSPASPSPPAGAEPSKPRELTKHEKDLLEAFKLFGAPIYVPNGSTFMPSYVVQNGRIYFWDSATGTYRGGKKQAAKYASAHQSDK